MVAADPVTPYMSENQLNQAIISTKIEMSKAAKNMDFLEAARLRDVLISYEDLLKEMEKKHAE